MSTATQGTTDTALVDVFDLDPQSTDLSDLARFDRFDATDNCSDGGCGSGPKITQRHCPFRSMGAAPGGAAPNRAC